MVFYLINVKPMSDELLFNISKTSEYVAEPFVKKDTIWVLDQNYGNYQNNQIIMDLSSISNSDKWTDWSTSYITIPVQITMSSAFNFSAVATDFAVGLKNGYHQLINSILVQYNNETVVQQQPLLNAYVSYKLNTELSTNQVQVLGASIGFALDTSTAYTYQGAIGKAGWGLCQNLDITTFMSPTALYQSTGNLGFLQRQVYGTLDVAGITGLTTIITQANISTFGRCFTQKNAAAVYQQSWSVVGQVRMRDLSDFFAKLPSREVSSRFGFT